jgi:probable rRNA maturation factor
MVEFVYKGIFHYRPRLEKIAELAAVEAFDYCGYKNFEIAILFTSETEICRLNGEYRKVEKVTDVISFPAADDFMGDNGFFGDLAISLGVAKVQARRYVQSLRREIAFLTIHGCLHLLGYDHKTEEEEMKMRAAQREILERLKEKLD